MRYLDNQISHKYQIPRNKKQTISNIQIIKLQTFEHINSEFEICLEIVSCVLVI